MAWYRAGTVSVTNGSASVTGSGTAFVANVSIGEGIVLPDGRIYEITNVSSDTSLTLATNYLGSTASGQPYAIAPLRGRIAQLLSETSSLIASFAGVRDGIGAGLFPDGTVTAPSFRFSSSQTTGIFRPGANRLAVSTNGVQRFEVDASGNALFTQTLQAPLGAVATPSYTFTGDLNTGMWSPAADTLAFSTNGGERLRVDSSGNVGIGTSSPSGKLQIANAGSFTAIRATNTTNSVQFDLVAASTVVSLGAATSHPLVFLTGNTERMRIDSAGNVGIGTSSPAARLQVVNSSIAGQFRLQDTVADATNKFAMIGVGHHTNSEEPLVAVFASSTASANNLFIGGGVTTGNAATLIRFMTAATNTTVDGTERMRITSSGNVGIGTSSPAATLDVQKNGDNIARFGDSFGNNTALIIENASGIAKIRYAQASDDAGNKALAFFGGTTERLRITSAGDVGIGTTSPNAAARLDVTSTTSGFLPPRMTTTQRDAIGSPPNGLLLYNTTTDKLQVRAGGAWVDLH
jgi:hypothetical protein